MTVEGLAALERRWRAVPDRIREEVTAAMEKVANEIVADMKQLAPKDSGALADSIGWTWGDAPEGSMTIGQVDGTEHGARTLTIFAGGADTKRTVRKGGTKHRGGPATGFEYYEQPDFEGDYALFQEFGTRNMPANPFFFPIWRIWKRRVRLRISRAVTRAIKKA